MKHAHVVYHSNKIYLIGQEQEINKYYALCTPFLRGSQPLWPVTRKNADVTERDRREVLFMTVLGEPDDCLLVWQVWERCQHENLNFIDHLETLRFHGGNRFSNRVQVIAVLPGHLVHLQFQGAAYYLAYKRLETIDTFVEGPHKDVMRLLLLFNQNRNEQPLEYQLPLIEVIGASYERYKRGDVTMHNRIKGNTSLLVVNLDHYKESGEQEVDIKFSTYTDFDSLGDYRSTVEKLSGTSNLDFFCWC